MQGAFARLQELQRSQERVCDLQAYSSCLHAQIVCQLSHNEIMCGIPHQHWEVCRGCTFRDHQPKEGEVLRFEQTADVGDTDFEELNFYRAIAVSIRDDALRRPPSQPGDHCAKETRFVAKMPIECARGSTRGGHHGSETGPLVTFGEEFGRRRIEDRFPPPLSPCRLRGGEMRRYVTQAFRGSP